MSIKTRRGDTIIEVMFGMAIFGLVSIATINLMNNGLANAENNLESTMARNEMNAQAEAIRFIHSTYASTNGESYSTLWNKIKNQAAGNDGFSPSDGGADCGTFVNNKGFVIDTASNINNNSRIITGIGLAETYPVVSNGSAQGVWVNAVSKKINGVVAYYDFYINVCWYGVGSKSPTTLDTVVRLHNPDRSF